VNVRFAGALASVLLLAGCDGWLGGAALVAAGHPDGRDTHRVHGGGDVSSFALVNGADVVRVRLADLGDDRWDVSTPDGAKVAPAVDVDGHEVVAGLHATAGGGPALVTVVLSSKVHWSVRLSGGANDESVDLTGGPGGDVDFSAGTSRAAVALPAAKGTQRVVLGGGAAQFEVRLAGDAPARVAAAGGAGSVTIDGTTHSGVAGGSMWTPDGWDSATDRYDIDATSGVSTLTVSRL
jgi:hypothetical protein